MASKGKSRKRVINDIKTDAVYFTPKERKQLLKALDEHGFAIIYDYDKLGEYLPTRKPNELRYLVESYKRKGKDLSSKQNQLEYYPEMKNVAEWSTIISSCVPFTAKKDDLSDVLKEIFQQLGETIESTSTERQEEKQIDYKSIHDYFNEILNNRFPAPLDDHEAALALSLINNLTEMVNSVENEDEKAYLRSGAWWKTPDINGSAESSSKTGSNSANGSINQNELISTTNQNSNQDKPTDEVSCDNHNRTENYEDLPRIRKIRECLNPLKVPVAMLESKHKLISGFFI